MPSRPALRALTPYGVGMRRLRVTQLVLGTDGRGRQEDTQDQREGANHPVDRNADNDDQPVVAESVAGCPASRRFGAEHQPDACGKQREEPVVLNLCKRPQ